MQFATLDPTVRRITGLGCGDVLAADTVGFVSDLPHELINAFRSTLLETREADLLLHVVDASDPWRMEREAEVEGVLADIGSDRIPRIRVLNKIDLVAEEPGVSRDDAGRCAVVRTSALTGAGLDALRGAISEALEGDRVRRWIRLGGREAKLRARLFELGAVDEEKIAGSGEWLLHVDLPVDAAEALARLPGREGAVARHQLLSDEAVAAATGAA
jgi:GTP-binding protein HflX